MRHDVEMRFSLHTGCELIVLVTNAFMLDAEDADMIAEVFAVHSRALRRIAGANVEREARREAAGAALMATLDGR